MAEEKDEKTSRCWPGFEPVPGKGEHEQGSCRKKSAGKNGGKQADRETARKKQVAMGGERGKQAKAASPDPSERKSVSKTAAKKTPAKKTAAKKTTAKRTPAKTSARTTSARKTAAKKAPAKKTAAKSTARKTPAKKRTAKAA